MTAGPQAPVLSELHREYLNAHAISDSVIERTQIFSWDFGNGPEIVFPWKDGAQVTGQRRLWPEPDGGLPAGMPKYTWEKNRPLHFWALRPMEGLPAGAPVIIAEGTKQALAVASSAPEEYAVYGMAGCWGWTHDGRPVTDLSRFAGRQVLILLDADAGANLNVYEGGENFAVQLELLGAVPGFVPSPAWGKNGIDDFLASVPPEHRGDVLAKLLAKGQARPADRKPAARKVADKMPDTGGRPMVLVNQDRLAVITEILGHMMARWNGRDLFCFGDVLTRVRVACTAEGQVTSARTEPVDRDSLLAWLSACVATYKYKRPGVATPGEYEPAWPDQQSVSAVLARGDEFTPLRRLSRTPFIREDGTVCAKQGYDLPTATLLITGNSGMDRLDIPDSPSAEQAGAAARYLMDEWLGDFCWRDDSSRASALALTLTPLIRGLVPLVPLAVISGLQPGVGKGLLADCIQLMITGEVSPPLAWLPDDDDENRKQITSAFRSGAGMMWFDEAHRIESHALSRAITSLTYADRILGVSKMASFPNQMTWLATGNQVSVSADMARRAYWIELHPDMPDPDSRPESAFRHPDLRGWTAENRPELITAALTLVRAWFAAGCPAYPRGALMGSFERWDKTMSGILGHAGVPGFLAGLAARRAESDVAGAYWSEHLAWVGAQFGTAEFTVLDVKLRALASGGTWDSPPRLDDPEDRGFPRNLGAAYSGVADRWFGPCRIIKTGIGHRKVQKWSIEFRDTGEGSNVPAGPGFIPPVPPNAAPYPAQGSPYLAGTQTLPDVGGRDAEGPEAASVQDLSASGAPYPAQNDTLPDLGFSEPSAGAVFPQTLPALGKDSSVEGLEVLEGSSSLGMNARAGARAHARTREGEGASYTSTSLHPSAAVPGLRLDFDLETDDGARLFLTPRGAPLEDGGFIRLAGITGPSGSNAILDVPDLVTLLAAAGEIGGHNILGFDGLALAWHHGVDWHEFCRRARDTELIARQAFPPRSREHGSEDKLGLDAVAGLLGLPGKTDELGRLKRKFGGYAAIPVDDPEYRAYLEGDLDASRGVGDRLQAFYAADPYLPREHRLAEIAGQISLNGFLVDQDLLGRRLTEGAQRKAEALALLHDGWGLPLTKTVTRGRGAGKASSEVAVDAPLATDAGRDWLASQWARYQVPDPPVTGTGKLAIGDEVLAKVAADPACPASLRSMIALMSIVTGTRTVYQTISDYLAPDGRVHPRISMRQASGRWSFTKPGLTVLGKHEGRHRERDVLIADPGHVLIAVDLSQVDMRAIAGHCQDPAYIALFAPGSDPHTQNAIAVFGSEEFRQASKAIGHGWNYGLGPKRMIESGMDPERVYAFVRGMEARYPLLISWREEIRAMGKAGMILDNGFGRRMLAEPSRAYTVAPALMGQGGARDIMGECLLRLDPALWPCLRGMIHDEIVLSVPERDVAEVRRECERAMTWDWTPPGKAMPVPVLCDFAGPAPSWGKLAEKG